MTVPGWCRAARAGVFAAACVLLAALGHAAMSGTPVPWWAMAAGALGIGAAGWLLAGRERGRVSIVAVVTAAQVVLHETFSLAQESASGSMTMSHGGPPTGAGAMHMGSMGSMDMGSMGSMRMDMGSAGHALHGMAGPGPLHDMAGMSGAASVGMFAAHFLAAVLCGLWLAYGERAVFRVLRATATWLAAPLRLLGALPTPYHRPGVHRRRAVDAPAPVRLLLCCSLTFRGPPVGAAVR
ncbi:hypothetical protein CQW39_29770 [Streptomyces griseofuscus]|uniref:hypothetical protein n=1 Tax=Streptomyces griseofuscus TaxID=146922 RepID=UPI000F654B64|nr:hypothetical protein [Streptomyces griseofuscus]RRQ73524.1 hypothetical protein CQW39_29770 [Streptomyces griseofuscus]